MKNNKKVYIETNGCSVVRHDTQRYSKYFRLNGYSEIDSPENADIILLTTCAVIKNTEDYSIFALRRLLNKKKKEAKLIVGGCLPRINFSRLSSEFSGFYFSKDEEYKLNDFINASVKIDEIFWDGDIIREHSLGDPDLIYSEEQKDQLILAGELSKKLKNPKYLEIYNYLTKGRFMWRENDLFEVKVADGCNYRCSYCATKNAKGDLKSREIEKVAEEFKFGVKKGYKKIVLTGDEVGGYGIDIGTNLIKLLNKILPFSGESRIALRYISPDFLVKYFEDLEPFFKSGKIYYFCSSFQSGSPQILKLMNRSNDISSFVNVISKISAKYPEVYKHTQVIIGFPRETECDFKKTLEVLKKEYFEYISVIKYSIRPNTAAFNMGGHLSESVIEDRYKRAKKLTSKLRDRKIKDLTYREILKQFRL